MPRFHRTPSRRVLLDQTPEATPSRQTSFDTAFSIPQSQSRNGEQGDRVVNRHRSATSSHGGGVAAWVESVPKSQSSTRWGKLKAVTSLLRGKHVKHRSIDGNSIVVPYKQPWQWLIAMSQSNASHLWNSVVVVMLLGIAVFLANYQKHMAVDTHVNAKDLVMDSVRTILGIRPTDNNGSDETQTLLLVCCYLSPLVWCLVVVRMCLVRNITNMSELEAILFPLTNHVIVCGCDGDAVRFAQMMSGRGYVVVVLAKRHKLAHTRLGSLPDLRILPSLDYDDEALKLAGIAEAKAMFVSTGNSARNVSMPFRVADLIKKASPKRKSKIHVWVNLKDIPTSSHMHTCDVLERAKCDSNIVLDTIDIHGTAARECITQHTPWGRRSGPPVDPSVDPPVHVMVVGLKSLGIRIVQQLIRIGHFADEDKLRITVVAETDAERISFELLKRQFPYLESIALMAFRQESPELLSRTDWTELTNVFGNVDTCYIADVENELRMIHIAMGISELMPKRGNGSVVCCSDHKHTSSHRAMFIPFESDFTVFSIRAAVTMEALVDSRFDIMAQVNHETYMQEYGGDAWHQLTLQEKESARHAADHFSVRIGTIKRVAGPHYAEDAVKLNTILNDPHSLFGDLMEGLATVEHRRWVASKMLEGWVPAYGKTRNEATKEHPALIPYDLLDESNKDKNRKMVSKFGNQLLRGQSLKQRQSRWHSSQSSVHGFGWCFVFLHLMDWVLLALILVAIGIHLQNLLIPSDFTNLDNI